MKNKIVLFLLLVSSLAFGQVPRVFTGKCNISQTGSGAGYWQVGVTNFDSPGGVYDAGDITVNDKLYFNDGGILYTLNITTIVSASGTNATIRVSNVGVTGISSVPTSAAEISRGTANYKFVPWTANMTDNDNQIVNEHSWYLADSLLAIQAAKGNITQGTLVAASASRTVPMNGQDLTFDNADDIRLEATGEYFIGSGSGDLPTLDSDNNGFDLGLGSSNEMVLHQRAADQVLSKAGAPVNGTDVAWYVGQLLVNTVDGSVYRATAKSTNPDFFGTGSTWSMLPTGATSGVTTFESRTGTVTSAAGDYTASEVTNVPAGTISGSTVQAAIDELATEKASVDSISAHRTDINNLQVLTGRVDGSTNMGTYTGTTIPDNQSVKQNVQSLETAIEGVLPKDITTFGYNPLTRVVTLGKSDGGTITGAVTEIVFVTAAPTGTPAFPVAIDTVGTDTMYVANNGAWVRFASGGGTISQPAGQVVYGTGASVASSANLFWDASNGRLGVGTNAPASKLDVEGGVSIGATYSGTTAAPTNGAIIQGNVGIGVTNPQTALEVVSSTAVAPMIVRNPTASSYTSYRLYNDQNSGARSLQVAYGGSAYSSALMTNGPVGESGYISTGGFPLVLGTDFTARMVFAPTTGYIGIGTASPTSKLDVTHNGIGISQNSIYGLSFVNNSLAGLNAQQQSPPVRWRGNGWKTDATAASQTVDFIADVLPVQGAAAPSGNWQLKASIDGAAYNTVLSANSAGNLTVSSNSGATTTEKLVTLNRPTTPTIGNETKLAFALAGTDVGVWSSKRESSSAYSMSYFTTNSGLLNPTPAIHLAQNNMVGINKDTASYNLDIKINSGLQFGARIEGSSTAAGMVFQNTTTGTTAADGLSIMTVGNDAAITNAENGDLMLQANTTALIVRKDGFVAFPTKTAAAITALGSVLDGAVVYVTSTDATFTSVGFWGRENGAWVKL